MHSALATVPNKTGIHARPASDVVSFCKGFSNHEIKLTTSRKSVNAKSMISVLSGGFKQYTEILVEVSGPDEEDVARRVAEFINNLND